MIKIALILVILSVDLISRPTFASTPLRIVFIAHPDVQDAKLTKSQLKRVFTMRQTNWSDGKLMQVVVYQGQSDLHQRMCKEMLNVFPYQLERFWNKLAYSGLGNMPEYVDSRYKMLEKVRTTPGSIGYIDADPKLLTLSEVKVLEL